MGWDDNVYYNPEASNLELVASVDFAGDYEFSMVAVWVDWDTNMMLYGTDSGCSCPVPFESQAKMDLARLDNWGRFMNHVEAMMRGPGQLADQMDFLRRVRLYRTSSNWEPVPKSL